jgi:hypothetical protein
MESSHYQLNLVFKYVFGGLEDINNNRVGTAGYDYQPLASRNH